MVEDDYVAPPRAPAFDRNTNLFDADVSDIATVDGHADDDDFNYLHGTVRPSQEAYGAHHGLGRE